ncbi:MAG: hypothetical protein ACTS4V_01870 [Candidatus Hodgkinia cicadicola]
MIWLPSGGVIVRRKCWLVSFLETNGSLHEGSDFVVSNPFGGA